MSPVSIIRSNSRLTPHKFYTEFLEDVANAYKNGNREIVFKLFEKGDLDPYDTVYRIEPIVIPLLLSLFEQLSKFHKKEIPILLNNNPATIDVLEFLSKCDFFHVGGDNRNPNYPRGRKIFSFQEEFLGAFKRKMIRNEHKVRAYSLNDDNLKELIGKYSSEEQKRDFLVSHYTYKVREHFQELLFDNRFTAILHNTYIDILSELITNAVLHSQSNAFVLMFVDRFKTKFSISDNGVGLEISMKSKQSTFYYEHGDVKKNLQRQHSISKIPQDIINNLHTIFETLYYSSLKDRHGLFDLMTNAVLNCQGYFRLHFENCQVTISSRMMDELKDLENIRNEIYDIHARYYLNQINIEDWKQQLKIKSSGIQKKFIEFYNKTVKKYSEDIVYSSLRFYKVKFRGVHVEVEIPNTLKNDNI